MTTPQASRINTIRWADFLRVAASFLVIMAHIEGLGGKPYWASVIYLILSRIGVPAFFMLSGFLLLRKDEPLTVFFKKRALKVLIPFFAWSIFYDIVWNQQLINSGFTIKAVLSLFIRVLRSTRAPHLWFLYPLIGLYILTPVLRVFARNAKKTELIYFIILWILVVPVFAIMEYYTPLSFGFELQLVTGYIGYYILGLYLSQLSINKKNNLVFIALFSLGLLSSFIIYFFNIPPTESVHENVYRSYLSINFIVIGIGAFGLLKAIGDRITTKADNIITILSKTSFGIYLIHPIVLQWINKVWGLLNIPTMPLASLWAIPLTTLLCYLISFVIISMMQKIPVIKTVVP